MSLQSTQSPKMNASSSPIRRGFSLIELVVVILILGVIAAIAAPRMFDTADDAANHSTRQTLAVIRNAIEIYRVRNQAYPPIGSGTEFQDALRPFLNAPIPVPSCLSGKTAGVIADTSSGLDAVADEDQSAGWVYKASSGSFKLNSTDAEYSAW